MAHLTLLPALRGSIRSKRLRILRKRLVRLNSKVYRTFLY